MSVWQLLMRERAGLEGLPIPVLELLQGEHSVLGLQTLPLQEHCLTNTAGLPGDGTPALPDDGTADVSHIAIAPTTSCSNFLKQSEVESMAVQP